MWRHLGGLCCELDACGAVVLGVPSEGIRAWAFVMRRKDEKSLHPLTFMEVTASADVEVVLPMVCGTQAGRVWTCLLKTQ